MFINVSNHPSDKWSVEQKREAEKYGEIIDVTFPQISTESTSEELNSLVDDFIRNNLAMKTKSLDIKDEVFMVQGEFVFTFRLVTMLKKLGIKAVSARSERNVKEINENGVTKKISEFKFAGFMEY